jgi:hypothetical protein
LFDAFTQTGSARFLVVEGCCLDDLDSHGGTLTRWFLLGSRLFLHSMAAAHITNPLWIYVS